MTTKTETNRVLCLTKAHRDANPYVPKPELSASHSPKAVHPNSREGQTIGAIMQIEHQPHHVDGKLMCEVGDFIETISAPKNESW